jgi:hypothetical protein
MGIIDYMRGYTYKEFFEKEAKKLISLGETPTIIDPEDYKKRFLSMI